MLGSQTFRASVICETDEGTAVVFDYSYVDTNPSPVHIDTGIAAGDFQSLVQTSLAAIMPTTVKFKKYRFATVTGPNAGEIGYVVVDPPVAGDLAVTTLLPTEMAISFKRNTGHASRGDRGRVFFGPIDQGFQDSGNPDRVAVVTELSTAADLGKAILVVGATTLYPCLLNAAGEWNGHTIINTSVGDVFVHRKTRRFRAGV
jgi:hypothetical protein